MLFIESFRLFSLREKLFKMYTVSKKQTHMQLNPLILTYRNLNFFLLSSLSTYE